MRWLGDTAVNGQRLDLASAGKLLALKLNLHDKLPGGSENKNDRPFPLLQITLAMVTFKRSCAWTWTMPGSIKARVLPEPVSAIPTMSLPERAIGQP